MYVCMHVSFMTENGRFGSARAIETHFKILRHLYFGGGAEKVYGEIWKEIQFKKNLIKGWKCRRMSLLRVNVFLFLNRTSAEIQKNIYIFFIRCVFTYIFYVKPPNKLVILSQYQSVTVSVRQSHSKGNNIDDNLPK